MELLRYWRILMRRIWLPILLVALVAISYILLTPQPVPTYSASMRFVVGVRPEHASVDNYTFDRYYTWLTAEYLLDDLSEVVKSQAFAADVAQRAGVVVPAGVIQGATSAGKLHRILSVSITWHNAQELELLSQAVVTTLEQNAATYFAQLSTENAVVSLIDPPTVARVLPSTRQRLDLPLRLILALIAGIASAFLLHYLDQSVQSGQEVEQMGVPLLARIPSQPTFLQRVWRRTSPR